MVDAYVICGTPRTGSTLLCDLLTSTGAAGEPDSFFRRQIIDWWADQWGVPARNAASPKAFHTAYLDAAIGAGQGGTAIFGLRLMRENLEELMAMIADVHGPLPSDRARFEKAFGRTLFIHLRREDKVAQAVSLVKAEQTGLWHVAPDGTEVERLAPPAEPEYDFDRLRRRVTELEGFDAAWTAWFGAEGIEPLRIGYETLSADPAGTLARICGALGVNAPAAVDVKPGVARLADATSAEWMRRYRDDAAADVPGNRRR